MWVHIVEKPNYMTWLLLSNMNDLQLYLKSILKSHSVSKKHLKLKDSKCKNNAITSYYGRVNSSTSLSATASSIAGEIYLALTCNKENWSGNSCENNVF